MIEAEVERDGKTTRARRYYLCSAPLSAPAFAAAVRAHWGIENRLHWVMDVVFHDDLMRLRTGSGPANMATIRHAALNIVKEIPDKASLKVRRKTLGWDDDYLLDALTQPAQMSFKRFPWRAALDGPNSIGPNPAIRDRSRRRCMRTPG